MQSNNLSRRFFLQASGASIAAAFIGTIGAYHARRADAATRGGGRNAPGIACGDTSLLVDSPYGPVSPVPDMTTSLPLLQLPKGFRYMSFAWTGDLMANGDPCPGRHDGMAVVTSRRGSRGPELVLIRNHELGTGAGPIIGAPAVYDEGFTSATSTNVSLGGTTNLVFRHGEWVSFEPSLGGTRTNCAGGPTPWGTWLTCEETGTDAVSTEGKKHGYVFEVRPEAFQTTGVPIVDMGRMAHEAVAIDPATGYAYLTEDARNLNTLYRFIPNDLSGKPGSLESGGRLQAAKVVGQPNASLIDPLLCDSYQLEWVDIDDPDQDRRAVSGLPGVTGSATASGPFAQAWERGALQMSRGEGIWYSAGKMFIVDTSAGTDANGGLGRGDGCVWELDLATGTLKAVFVAGADSLVGNNPDNITVSPRGGILLCEDGGGVTDAFGFGERLLGLTHEGNSFIFCKNNIVLDEADLAVAGKDVGLAGDSRGNEFCGACWDPSGQWLFVNVQTPGVTFAISGPWGRGVL